MDEQNHCPHGAYQKGLQAGPRPGSGGSTVWKADAAARGKRRPTDHRIGGLSAQNGVRAAGSGAGRFPRLINPHHGLGGTLHRHGRSHTARGRASPRLFPGPAALLAGPSRRSPSRRVTQIRDDLLRCVPFPSSWWHRKSPPPQGYSLHADLVGISKLGRGTASRGGCAGRGYRPF